MDGSKEDVFKRCFIGDKIRAYIATDFDSGNYGDLLARYVVEKLSQRQSVKYNYDCNYHLCSVGSVLDRNEICCNTVVWGSGFLAPQPLWKIKLTVVRQFFRRRLGKPLYLAVRGIGTRNIIQGAGYDCPHIMGDPALMMPVFYKPERDVKYKIGVVLHYHHDKLKSLFENRKDIKIIDIMRPYSDIHGFIDDIMSCEAILSSSLHGLIISNAYRVPCVRLRVNGFPMYHPKKTREDFKFNDYVSGLNVCKMCNSDADYTMAEMCINKDEVINNEFSKRVVELATAPNFVIDLNPLAKAFPFLSEEYKHVNFCV